MTDDRLVDMRGVEKRFGGVHAVRGVSLHVGEGEVLGILGHNGAGKSVLMNVLAGVYPASAGEIHVSGQRARLSSPRDARRLGIETIYQTLALADNLDAVANLFLGRELRTPWRTMDHRRMHREARHVLQRINPRLTALDEPGQPAFRRTAPVDRDREGRLLQRPHSDHGRAHRGAGHSRHPAGGGAHPDAEG